MRIAHTKEVLGWLRRWRSLPVLSWTRAATYFSQGSFADAAREYQRGLARLPLHPVAPFARLDLAVCFERLGAFDQACDQLMLLAHERDDVQLVARLQLCQTLILSDRNEEAAKIAALLKLEDLSVRSRRQLLPVKALALLDAVCGSGMLFKPTAAAADPKLSAALHPGTRSYGLVSGAASAPRTGPRTGPEPRLEITRPQLSIASPKALLPDAGALSALKSARSAPDYRERLAELRRHRNEEETVNFVLEIMGDGAAQSIADAEGKDSAALWIWIAAGQYLLERRDATRARRILNRALAIEPRAPKILALLARTYLVSGEGYNPSFALQLATKACQHAGWRSSRAHAALAECYYHSGDKLAALTVAKNARITLADSQIESLLESLTEQLNTPKARSAA